MATPVKDIYKQFLSLINDEEMLLLEEEIIEDMMYSYLQKATFDFYECRKDLSIIGQEEYCITIPIGQLEFIIEYNNKFAEIKLIGKYTDKEYEINKDYIVEFREEDCIITFETETEEEILLKSKYLGEIISDLDLDEIIILAYGMMIWWLQPKILREENLKQMLTDSDYNTKSGANMLAKLCSLEIQIREQLAKYKTRYSYKGFKGWDKIE
ncbi:TPA: hypothetical protein SOL37_002577 [Clostridioides difficile]|uniref:hypothetical protein n=1 Tax=Clostridioides difficile TaxID=1496 RepID=UPI00097FDA4B|nr:hypothetical protein [Clostridioides difficile]EGT3659619.1 hypothetical protein [Clostridioides difficile]EGT5488409.1 hypothetical protein [Clostridioides difficile]MBH7262145.1 hypothetical protein [Clostridioides difficile]MCL6820281.1 hypothetical protein [Clostridioides difficile]MDL5147531.1 hypothetical protein [Clostridioides difficile]